MQEEESPHLVPQPCWQRPSCLRRGSCLPQAWPPRLHQRSVSCPPVCKAFRPQTHPGAPVCTVLLATTPSGWSCQHRCEFTAYWVTLAGRQAGPLAGSPPCPGAQHGAGACARGAEQTKRGLLGSTKTWCQLCSHWGRPALTPPPQQFVMGTALPHLMLRPSSLASHRHCARWMTTGHVPSSPLVPCPSLSLVSLRHSLQWIPGASCLVSVAPGPLSGCLWVPGRGSPQTQICLTF